MDNPTIQKPQLLRGRHECETCGSSDSMGYYDDHYTCYGTCNKTWFYGDTPGGFKSREVEEVDFKEMLETIDQIQTLPVRGSKPRGIYNYIYEFYGVHSEIKEDGTPGTRYYPWYRSGKLNAYKQKHDGSEDKKKAFYMKGDTQIMNRKDCQLFGQNLFEAGGRMLVITEGEDDCCAVQQAYHLKYGGKRFPVVSLFNVNVDQVFMNNLDWIMSFEKVILWPDRDKTGAGLDTMERYAKAIGPKAVIVGCTKYKDANDALRAEKPDYIINQIFNAQPYMPAGFVKGEELWNRFKDRKDKVCLPYPDCLSGLNTLLKGMRLNEIVLFTSGTGSGKSTVTKEIMLHIIAQPDTKLGIVSLEEDVGETVEKFIEMAMQTNFQEDEVSKNDEVRQREAYETLFASERVIVLDHQGSVGDESLINKLRALSAMGCTHIILDHITIAVSEGNEGFTGNEAVDKMMSDLLKLVKQFPIWLGVISHLRKTGAGGKSFEEGHMASLDDIKGSGSIKQVSFDIIAFARNMIAEDERTKNTIRFRVLKARYTGNTGEAGSSFFNKTTRRLEAISATAVASVESLFKAADAVSIDKMKERMGL